MAGGQTTILSHLSDFGQGDLQMTLYYAKYNGAFLVNFTAVIRHRGSVNVAWETLPYSTSSQLGTPATVRDPVCTAWADWISVLQTLVLIALVTWNFWWVLSLCNVIMVDICRSFWTCCFLAVPHSAWGSPTSNESPTDTSTEIFRGITIAHLIYRTLDSLLAVPFDSWRKTKVH